VEKRDGVVDCTRHRRARVPVSADAAIAPPPGASSKRASAIASVTARLISG
jgi:hypothetical protein